MELPLFGCGCQCGGTECLAVVCVSHGHVPALQHRQGLLLEAFYLKNLKGKLTLVSIWKVAPFLDLYVTKENAKGNWLTLTGWFKSLTNKRWCGMLQEFEKTPVECMIFQKAMFIAMCKVILHLDGADENKGTAVAELHRFCDVTPKMLSDKYLNKKLDKELVTATQEVVFLRSEVAPSFSVVAKLELSVFKERVGEKLTKKEVAPRKQQSAHLGHQKSLYNSNRLFNSRARLSLSRARMSMMCCGRWLNRSVPQCSSARSSEKMVTKWAMTPMRRPVMLVW